jgi:hypothetical protein
LTAKNHNFIRLWSWEAAQFDDELGYALVTSDFPWLRTGPGNAADGKPKFDLTQPNPAFYARLRSKVIQADASGFYVDVMLFEGLAIRKSARWVYHPFNPANNVNGIDGAMGSYHTLNNPTVNAIQGTYIRAAIDAVNDLDNVLFEVSNESLATSADVAWQYAVIDEIRAYELTKPLQHPIGMTWQYAAENSFDNAPLWASTADWISPGCSVWPCGNGDNYATNPPASTGAKVVISDTDHVYGIGGDAVWVWRQFLRGLNPIFMDNGIASFPATGNWEGIRNAMGHVRTYAATIDLLAATPQNALCSSGFCLMTPNSVAALSFVSGKGKRAQSSVTVQLQPGVYSLNWFNPANGQTTLAGTVNHSGGSRTFTAPADATYVLMISK